MIRRKFLKFLGAVPVVGAIALAIGSKPKAEVVTLRKGYRPLTAAERVYQWDAYSGHCSGYEPLMQENFADRAARTMRKHHAKMVEQIRKTNALLG